MPISHLLFGVFSIILIDLTLAGDNALVIAMGRAFPAPARAPHRDGVRRGRAPCSCGSRSPSSRRACSASATWQLAGGLFHRVDRSESAGGCQRSPDSRARPKRLLQAIWYVVFADLTMSTDNILAIAGASKGSVELIVFRALR